MRRSKTDETVQCQCGEATGVRCAWSGPAAETVVVEYMPEHLRASHEAAGNSGAYPHNGSIRIRVEHFCADYLRGCTSAYGVCGDECPVHGDAEGGDPWVQVVG